MNKIFQIVIIVLLIVTSSFQSLKGQYISLKQKTELVEHGKKISSSMDLFFDKSKLTVAKVITSPDLIYIFTNRLGETKIYYPETNQVSYMQSEGMSSKNEMIYYFAHNLTDQLGLADEGFSLASRSYENQYLVTVWNAPVEMNLIDRVKMVFDGANPIYAEYISRKEKIIKKIYYSQYNDYISFRLPLRITEIAFSESGDSTIKRTIFSNLKVLPSPNSEFFDFQIPDNAEPIKKKLPVN
ncbi:MAG TPA: hypothetical protein VJY41_14810 [Prolixibacteraceae bacterium]|nr:hypothetical protein [Prolixibacteraceae bacterium]